MEIITIKVVANKMSCRICLRKIFLAPNTSTFQQTALAGEVHLADGQYVYGGENLNSAKSLKFLTGTRRPAVSKTEG
jgi:hypothetical protein